MANKLCVSCNDAVDNLTEKLFSSTNHKIPHWFKTIGNYSLLPPPINCNPMFNLYHRDLNKVSEIYPREYDTSLAISTQKLLPGVTNTWLFYWAAKGRNYLKTKYPPADVAYGSFKNCGLAYLDGEGKTTFKFKNPKPYEVDGIAYPPHLHFVALGQDKLWNSKLHTYLITPDVDLKMFKILVKSQLYLVLNSMPEGSGDDDIPGTDRLPYNTPKGQINNKILGLVSDDFMKYHKYLTDLPIIIYCQNRDCAASDLLIDKLRQLSYINIITFKGGLDEYYR